MVFSGQFRAVVEVWGSEGVFDHAGSEGERDVATQLEASYPLCVNAEMNELDTN